MAHDSIFIESKVLINFHSYILAVIHTLINSSKIPTFGYLYNLLKIKLMDRSKPYRASYVLFFSATIAVGGLVAGIYASNMLGRIFLCFVEYGLHSLRLGS